MPKVGEIKRGRDINKKDSKRNFIWCACPNCGKERWVSIFRKDKLPTGFCSPCAAHLKAINNLGDKNPAWKGGQYRHEGYVLVLKPEHPSADSRGYVKRARLVLEQKLNRHLWPTAEAHHINGIRDDDRSENLMELFYDEHAHLSGKAGGRPRLQTLEERQRAVSLKEKRRKPPSKLREVARLLNLQQRSRQAIN